MFIIILLERFILLDSGGLARPDNIPLRINSREGTIQSPAPGHPATFGGSKMFWPKVDNSFGIEGQVSGSLPVDLIVPMMKSTGDLTIVARFWDAQNDFELRVDLKSVFIS